MNKLMLFVWIVFIMICGCGNPSSFSANSTIHIVNTEQNKTNEDLGFMVLAQKKLKRQWGDSYISSVADKDNKNIYVVVKEVGQYKLLQYSLTQEVIQMQKVVVEDYNRLIEVYPLKDDKIIYVMYPVSHADTSEITIYDTRFYRKLQRYRFTYFDDYSFILDPNETYFIFHHKKTVLPDLERSEAEKELIERYTGKLRDIVLSKDKKYAYVVFIDHAFNFKLFVLNGQKNHYIEKYTIGRIYANTTVYAVDIDTKYVAFFYYDQKLDELSVQTYDCMYGELLGEPVVLNHIDANQIIDAYISDDRRHIKFLYNYNDGYSIDISNIYQPKEIY